MLLTICLRSQGCITLCCSISSMRRSVSSPDETPRRELKIRRAAELSGMFLTNFEVIHLVMKHCVEYLILLLEQKDFRRTRISSFLSDFQTLIER